MLFPSQVRVHCFFYLLPVGRGQGGGVASALEAQEPHPEVLRLIKDLSSVDEALTSSLQPRKCKVGLFNLDRTHSLLGSRIIYFIVIL